MHLSHLYSGKPLCVNVIWLKYFKGENFTVEPGLLLLKSN